MRKHYKVSFRIIGDYIDNGINLNKKNLKIALDKAFNEKSQDYYGNRNLNTYIKDLKITEFNLPF